MAKRKRRVSGYSVAIRNPQKGIRIMVHGRTKKEAKARASSFIRKNLKNVEQGFVDATGLHPIRGSSDYSASRAGEGRSIKAGRTRAKRSTKKARRGRQAIS